MPKKRRSCRQKRESEDPGFEVRILPAPDLSPPHLYCPCMTASFESIHHPGDAPSRLIYARQLAGPVGACTTPVMIGATVAALQGQSVWMYTVWGLPMALAVASAWTRFTLSVTPAEVYLRTGRCAVRSVLDVLRDRPPNWNVLYGVEESASEVKLLLGWNTRVLRRREWPRFEHLRDASRQTTRSMPNSEQPSSVP
jgi:hypothetical protein